MQAVGFMHKSNGLFDFSRLWSKNKIKQYNKYLDLAWELNKSWNSSKKPGKETGETGNQKNNENHIDHSTVKIH